MFAVLEVVGAGAGSGSKVKRVEGTKPVGVDLLKFAQYRPLSICLTNTFVHSHTNTHTHIHTHTHTHPHICTSVTTAHDSIKKQEAQHIGIKESIERKRGGGRGGGETKGFRILQQRVEQHPAGVGILGYGIFYRHQHLVLYEA